MEKKQRMDWILLVITALLAVFGVVMVYSASAMISDRETDGATQYAYFYKQAAFTAIGLVLMIAASRFNYRWLMKPWIVYGVLFVTVVLLAAVFAFPPVNGARRWIRIGGFSLQPSEMAKIALPLFAAYFLTKNEDSIGNLKETVIPCVAVLGVVGGLVFFEPDLGTVIVLCAIFVAVYFSAGAKFLHIAAVGAGLLAVGVAALVYAPWRIERLIAFMDPFEKADSSGYQVVQSLYAIGSGGVFGEGFGRGEQKLFYLPYPHSDFIFAVVGEELGLIGAMAVLVAFGLLLWRGARSALLAPERFGMLLGIGLITGIIVQALFNISVVISILPPKGIPLPFISYGGSSILVTLVSVGILLNISQYSGYVSLENGLHRTQTPRKERKARRVKKGRKVTRKRPVKSKAKVKMGA
ncbi:MAG: putative lipid II flippase FtsW [Acidobacteria bacterium]|nr:MAG: putative lipid II flippase FtsW [Acidobacteriota bacterium]REK02303.1 MAG: putative lipid II flippase FtsW [Acidobacteriota bacterium]REK13894.1 MAG: putative lipid II flippase FtsW [Acidobacteriota bacterium]REK41888.1 MAG: putative lipid II flippase FtsW [Acidobacteriota bacterium]